MSLNSMANAAMSRRPDFEPAGTVPKGYGDITRATGAMPPAPIGPDGQPSPPVPTTLGTSLQTLTTYIPTEVLTLYVAAIAAVALFRFNTNATWLVLAGAVVGVCVLWSAP